MQTTLRGICPDSNLGLYGSSPKSAQSFVTNYKQGRYFCLSVKATSVPSSSTVTSFGVNLKFCDGGAYGLNSSSSTLPPGSKVTACLPIKAPDVLRLYIALNLPFSSVAASDGLPPLVGVNMSEPFAYGFPSIVTVPVNGAIGGRSLPHPDSRVRLEQVRITDSANFID